MLDLSHISSQQQSTFTFYAQSGSWQTFQKPRNAKFIEIFCLGAGGGGGHSINGATTVNGPGGGGSGGIVRGIIPAFLLPDTFYIQVGKGGTGGRVSGNSGLAGGISYISLNGTTSEQTLICKSSTGVAGGGGPSQTAGVGATVAVPALSAFGNLGLFTAIVGVVGSTGGLSNPTVGSSQIALATNITTGGAGGGGKSGAAFAYGGTIIAAPVILTSTVAGGQITGQDGNNGYGTFSPFCGTGGAGGASIITGIGGKGGKGFYGCGGGGGGAGSVTGGFGGDGGDGLVIITVIS